MVDSGTFKTTSYLQESDVFEHAKSGVLLSNTRKDERLKETAALAARRGIDPSSDLGKLDVCFGGFSPTAMGSDIPALRELAAAVEKRQAAQKEAKMKAAAVEAARASEVREFACDGTAFKYVVLDGVEVRIEKCETGVADLKIPHEIESKPVVALAGDSCSGLESVESISVPDAVVAIGYSAFRDCPNLRALELPASLVKYDPGWLRGSQKVERIKLPGKLEKITPAIFDAPSLKVLEVGAEASEVMAGSFQKSQLESISVSEENPFMASDGKALYSKDGSILVALCVPCQAYKVADGCMAIARKGFSSFECVSEVELPDTVEVIGDFALTRTSIRSFFAPKSLRAIGERAFFACKELRVVVLNDGLTSVAPNAFSDTAISELRMPSSIRELGNPVASGTSLSYSGANATFSIDEGDEQVLFLDEQGGLYRKNEDGLHLARMLEENAQDYVVKDGTVAIDDLAFAKHPTLVQAILPEGLRRIGAGAFKDARNLVDVNLPSTLETIGEEAFLDTSLSSLSIPAALCRIGVNALATYGAHHGGVEPSLRRIEVDPENARYYMESGLLIEHMDGFDRVILCTGSNPDVVVPDTVTAIGAYAFHGVRTLRTLSLSDRITMVEIRGLAFDSMVDNVHVDLVEPIEGHAFFDFAFPKTSRGFHQMGHAFGTPNFVNVEAMFDHYDNAIVNRSGFDSATEGNQLSAYEQAQRIIERLNDPVMISNTNRNLMDGVLSKHLEEICVDAARHDDKSVIEGLLDLGYITADNIGDVTEAVGAVQDASITNYLLEQKRLRFGGATIDFSL